MPLQIPYRFCLISSLCMLLLPTLLWAQCSSGRFVQAGFFAQVDSQDVVYRQTFDYSSQAIDLHASIYAPSADPAPERPLIIWLHGGDLLSGSRSDADMVQLARHFAGKGYLCASIDYRTGFDASPVSASVYMRSVLRAVQDVKAAIRFFKDDRQQGNFFRADTENIFLAGSSTGGLIALHSAYMHRTRQYAMLGTAADVGQLGGIEGTGTTASSRVRAVASLSGAMGRSTWLESCDVPLLLMHSNDDNRLPFRRAQPQNAAGQNYPFEVEGSKMLDSLATLRGVGHQLFTWNGLGHAPYALHPNPAVRSQSMGEVQDFLTTAFCPLLSAPLPPISPRVDLGAVRDICQGSTVFAQVQAGQPATYMWSTGSTASSLSWTPTQAPTSIWVEVSANGCSVRDTLTVRSLYPLPSVNLGPDLDHCSGESFVLDAGAGATSYLWHNGSSAQQLTVLASSQTSGWLWAEVIDSRGCSQRDSVFLTVRVTPVVNLGPDRSLCPGDSTLLSVPQIGAQIVWSTGQTGQDIQVSSPGKYWVRVSQNGCTASDTLMVLAAASPAAVLPADTFACAGSSVLLQGPAAQSYLWNTGASTSSINVVLPGTYWLRSTQGSCTRTDTVKVVLRPKPVFSLGPDTTVCALLPYTLSPGIAGATYLWSNGSTQASLTQAYSQPTTVWLRLSQNGCTSTDTVQINVKPGPYFNFGPDTALCQGDTLKLKPGVAGALAIRWMDGRTDSLRTWTGPGLVWAEVDKAGCTWRDTLLVNQALKPQPVLNCSGTVLPSGACGFCPGAGLKVWVSGQYDSVRWAHGPKSDTLMLLQAGKYVLWAYNGCGSTLSDTLKVEALPAVSAPALFQRGDSLLSLQGYSTYQWYRNGVEVPGAMDYWLVPDSSGQYTVEVTNEWGCTARAQAVQWLGGTGLAQILDPPTFVLQPNPSRQLLRLKYRLEGRMVASVQVLDLQGRTLVEDSLKNAEGTWETSIAQWADGVYNLRIFYLDGQQSLRFVKD